MENYSLSDIRAAVGDENMSGGGNNFWLVLLFLIIMMSSGIFGGGGANGALTRAEMQQGFDTAEVTRKLDGLTAGICDSTYALTNTITSEGRATQAQLSQIGYDTRLGIAELGAQQDRNTCAITTAIHAEGEATRALIRENEIQALRDKVQALELNNAMCGVVRYPNQTVYNSGCNPFAGSNCCGNNI